MNKKKARVRIRGAWWRILIAAPPNAPEALGLCDYESKTIYVRPGADLVETLVHEATHAACPDLDETAVEYIELAIINSLFAMGCLEKL